MRAQKVAILTEVMGFTEAEDEAFWPIYREYDAEMAKLGDERVALIAEYARNYATLTDAVAEKLASKALDLEARRQALKAKYYERIKTALSPRTALRFLQVEHSCCLIIDLQISAALPIVQVSRRSPMRHPNRSMDCRDARRGTGASLSADRVRLRSGKVVEGMFIGGDSKTVRVLLDNGRSPRFRSKRRSRRVHGAEAAAAPPRPARRGLGSAPPAAQRP